MLLYNVYIQYNYCTCTIHYVHAMAYALHLCISLKIIMQINVHVQEVCTK